MVLNGPGKVQASDENGRKHHPSSVSDTRTNCSHCTAKLSELGFARSADSGKFAIPTADGTILTLTASSAAVGKYFPGHKCEKPLERSCGVNLLVCQPK